MYSATYMLYIDPFGIHCSRGSPACAESQCHGGLKLSVLVVDPHVRLLLTTPLLLKPGSKPHSLGRTLYKLFCQRGWVWHMPVLTFS